MDITISGLSKRFGAHEALRSVDLDVRSGELLALLGPSGSGKTTLLRVLAGLEQPDSGLIRFGVADASSMTLRERRVGLVFQHYALFRHMTAFENVAFGLKVRPGESRPPRGEIRDRVEKLLDLVQMRGFGGRYPSQLSGGQRQRIALARALAIEPQVLLLDEPFGALDAQVRRDLRRQLRRLHEEIHVTSVFVTHDQEEALELADRVVVMSDGSIEQIGTPAELYGNPASAFVYGFIGEATGLDVRVADGGVFWNGGRVPLPAQSMADGPARLFLRPHDLALASSESGLAGRIRHARPRGAGRRIEIILSDQTTILEADAPDDAAFDPGRSVALEPKKWGLFRA